MKQIDLELGEVGVEAEDVGAPDAPLVTDPYDPAEIRIKHQQPTIVNLMRRIAERELNIRPSFQRKSGIWSENNQSRLVESLLLGIPLPAFYFDATDPDNWLVVDGLQRLTALARYVLTEEELAAVGLTRLVLIGLEFIQTVEGTPFPELPRRHRRAIEEAQVSAYLIEPGTPAQVKFNVFKRINTGGLPLSAQEIRHALNQGGPAEFLERLASSEAFSLATAGGISGERMADRECVLRFVAFVDSGWKSYQSRDFDFFLSQKMAQLASTGPRELENLERRFARAMNVACDIFGNDAFRKRIARGDARKPINKALFEAWSVALDARTDRELAFLVAKKNAVIDAFMLLMNDADFDRSISQGTGDIRKIGIRFSAVESLLTTVSR